MNAPALEGFAPVVRDVYRAAYEAGAGGACRQLLQLRDELRAPARVVVVGERSRGKSSLINALLRREDLLPVDVDVASNVFVVLTHTGNDEQDDEGPDGGQGECVEVRFADGTEPRRVPVAELAEYTSELGNPDNEQSVESALVRLNHPLLARGLEIVDTPGVGGLVTEHGSMTFQAARRADGLVMVLEAAKPISQPEVQFIEMLAGEGGGLRVVFCLTKADLYQGRDVTEMTQFLTEALDRHAPRLAGSPAVCVSAERLWRALRRSDPDERRQLAETSGMPGLLRGISTHLLAGVERDRVDTLLAECDRILDDLARPHTERLTLLSEGGDPAPRLRQLQTRLAALPDPARLRTEVRGRVDRLRDRADRDLRAALEEMNNDLEDQIADHWKRSMRRTLPAEYDQRFRTIWLEVVNDFNDGLDGLSREHAEELGVTVPGLTITVAEMGQSKRAGKRVRGWARIAWMSLVSLGFMFPFQYMEHREAMRNADKADAQRWLRRCVRLQARSRDTLRDHAAAAATSLTQALERPVTDQRRSLRETVASLQDLHDAGGADRARQQLEALHQLTARVAALRAAGEDPQ
jgi:GTPase SAR1 family protein